MGGVGLCGPLGNIGDRYWSGVLPVPDEPCKVMTGRLPQIEPRRSLAQCDLARMRRDAEEVGAGLAEVLFTAPEHYDHPCNWLGQAQGLLDKLLLPFPTTRSLIVGRIRHNRLNTAR